jgi:hypothetical protein
LAALNFRTRFKSASVQRQRVLPFIGMAMEAFTRRLQHCQHFICSQKVHLAALGPNGSLLIWSHANGYASVF